MKTHRYGMRLRGFSPMCQPMEGFIAVDNTGLLVNGRYYWSILTYDRKLSETEVSDYELDYLGESKGYLCDICGYDNGDCEYPQENHCELFVKRV